MCTVIYITDFLEYILVYYLGISFKVYVSDFGEERLAEEEVAGPKELKEFANKESDNDDGREGEENIEVTP